MMIMPKFIDESERLAELYNTSTARPQQVLEIVTAATPASRDSDDVRALLHTNGVTESKIHRICDGVHPRTRRTLARAIPLAAA